MKRFHLNTAAFLALAWLCSCSPREKSFHEYAGNLPGITEKNPVVHRWTWRSGNIYAYGSLLLKADSTFQYESGGCMGACYSAGTWNLKGNTIVLNSYERYLAKAQEEPVIDFPEEPSTAFSITDSDRLALSAGNFTLKVTPDPGAYSYIAGTTNLRMDSTGVFFKDKLLVYENDTLYELSEYMGAKNGIRYYKSEN